MKPAFKNTKNMTHTNSLFQSTRNKAALLVVLYCTFLMSLTTVAGTRDTVSKKDSCCSTGASTKAINVTTVIKSRTAIETPSNTTDPNAAAESMKMSAASFQVQLASSDDDLNTHFAASNFQVSTKAHAAACDALTDVQVQRPVFTARFAVADRKLAESFQASFNLDMTSFATENAAKLLIKSDKNLTQHFNQQYGMEVASVK